MATEHWGGWWIVFFLMAFFFWRPWGRRRHCDPRSAQRAQELDETVRARLELVDQLETRVTELENRLDFTERLLAERREERAVSH